LIDRFIKFVRSLYQTNDFIPLHEPQFIGNEKKYILDAIDSTFVSSVGKYVNELEDKFAKFVGSKHAVATVNGTSALHAGLLVAGVEKSDEVITQPLTFVATCNAIHYCGATPRFVAIDKHTLGLSSESLAEFLNEGTQEKGGFCYNKKTGKRIKACVPMHTFGHPVEIVKIRDLCKLHGISLIEDAAESLGSYYQGKHSGTFGELGIFSFNGNKVITTGGGGMIVTDDESLAKRAKHLTTTAKVPHKWDYVHDEVGYNYRMPNINAALGVAQLEQLPLFLERKRNLAKLYQDFFSNEQDIEFVKEREDTRSNYWLNAILLENKTVRDIFLQETNNNRIMTRPVWTLMNKLDMYASSEDFENSNDVLSRLVNIPSTPIVNI
jgi:perosamine synthetase